MVPHVHRSTFGTRAFFFAGPTVWNSLPDNLLCWAGPVSTIPRDASVYQLLTFCARAFEVFLYVMRSLSLYIYRRFTYLLTYLHAFCSVDLGAKRLIYVIFNWQYFKVSKLRTRVRSQNHGSQLLDEILQWPTTNIAI